MAEPVEWGADGTPRSPRFDDLYRPARSGLAQARHVFLAGCGLPAAWRGRRAWRVLETGFGLGLNFLATWRAWQEDALRPALLHYVSIEAWPVGAPDLLRSVAEVPELHPLAQELAAQWYGMSPGFHRMSFEDGQVVLTLCVGDVQEMLAQQAFHADSIYLDGFDPARNPAMWAQPVLKAAARLARHGTGIGTWTVAGEVRRRLAPCGFEVEKVAGVPPKRDCLRGTYAPHWVPRLQQSVEPATAPGRCMVIGAGLAGAAAAASLARRGWAVQVLDAAGGAAAGASGLPAGLLAAHQSPDDNLLSRLSRAGVRLTLREAGRLLPAGEAWQRSGVLEHRLGDGRPPPALDGIDAWTRVASGEEKQRAGLAPGEIAWWHDGAGWIRPGLLVRALLETPGVERRWHARVKRLEPCASGWQAIGEDAAVLCEAQLVVVAAAHDSAALLPRPLVLHPVRGQVSWSHDLPAAAPPFPMNGNGHFLPRVMLEAGEAWLTGSTYGHGDTLRDERAEDHAANLERLRALAPHTARALAPQFEAGRVQGWSGIRCTSSDRRPLVGPLAPGLWVSTAMGSRGLTFAVLCAELLAARLHGEPLPLPQRLAAALAVERQLS